MEDLYTYDTGNYSDYMGGSSFDSPPSSLDESTMTILAVMGIIALVIFILQIVAKWKIFTKADEHGWAALIPFYNTYVLYKITWENGLFFLLSYIPCLNVIVTIMTNMKLAAVFGKGDGFAIGLSFLSVIFYPILGFDSSEYDGPFYYN